MVCSSCGTSNAEGTKFCSSCGNAFKMKGRWSNSVGLVKESWNVLRNNKALVVFPVISGVLCLILLAAVMVPAAFLSGITGGKLDNQWVFYIFFFIFYFIASFITIFMNTGLIACAQISLQGGDPSFSDGIDAAKKHLGKIAGWAAINATVGFVLRMIRERGGIFGAIAASIVAVAWNLITFFVIPVIIFQEMGVIASIKESAEIFKRTWGENMVARFSIGLIFFLFALIGIVPMGLAVLTRQAAVIIPVAFIVVLYWTALAIMTMALNGILATALYDYAVTGQVPSAFTTETITGAFAPGKEKKKLFR